MFVACCSSHVAVDSRTSAACRNRQHCVCPTRCPSILVPMRVDDNGRLITGTHRIQGTENSMDWQGTHGQLLSVRMTQRYYGRIVQMPPRFHGTPLARGESSVGADVARASPRNGTAHSVHYPACYGLNAPQIGMCGCSRYHRCRFV